MGRKKHSLAEKKEIIKPKMGRLARIGRGISILALAGAFITGTSVYYLQWWVKNKTVPYYSELYLKDLKIKYSPTILSSDGFNIGSFLISENNKEFLTEERERVTKVPEVLEDAVIGFEDREFYRHTDGFELERLVKAVYETAKGNTQGGSTIPMQVGKMIKGERDQDVDRKIKDIYLAMALERKFSKEKIMNMYFNYSYFGHRKYGIYSACEYYFNRNKCKGITLGEAAILVSFLKNPVVYSANERIAKEKRDGVLRTIAELDFIQEKYGKNFVLSQINEPVVFSRISKEKPYPFISVAVETELRDKLGRSIYTDGLTIHTTINSKMQKSAEAAMTFGFQENDKIVMEYYDELTDENGNKKRVKRRIDGGFVALNARTRGVLAFVGGRDWKESQNLFALAQIQPGSGIKPLIYATALEEKVLTPDSIISDAVICIPGKCFSNYGGGGRGSLPMWQALQKSQNRPAMRILLTGGIGNTFENYYFIGAKGPLVPNPQFALGASEVSVMELASAAAAVFDGYAVAPSFIEYVENANGRIVLDNRQPVGQRILDNQTSTDMKIMMQRVPLPGGTAKWLSLDLEAEHFKGVKINPDVNKLFKTGDKNDEKTRYNAPNLACKTGTETNSHRAGLTCIYSDSDREVPIVAVNYFGYRDPKPMSGKVDITGALTSKPVHLKFIESITREKVKKGKNFKSFTQLEKENIYPATYTRTYQPDTYMAISDGKDLETITINGENLISDILGQERGKENIKEIMDVLGIKYSQTSEDSKKPKAERSGVMKLVNLVAEHFGKDSEKISKIEKNEKGFNVHVKKCKKDRLKTECSSLADHYEFSAKIKQLSYLRDDQKVLAIRFLDEKDKLHTYIKNESGFQEVQVVDAKIKSGCPFATSWLRHGLNDAKRFELQTMFPKTNFDRINIDFSYKVLLSDNEIMAAEINETNPDLVVYRTSKAVTIDDYCMNDSGIDCQGKEWPTRKGKLIFYNLDGRDSNEGGERTYEKALGQIRAPEGTDVYSSGVGVVAFSSNERGSIAINYNNGFAAEYDGIYSTLQVGDKVTEKAVIGEIDNRNNLFIRAKKGSIPSNLKDLPDVRQEFRKDIGHIVTITRGGRQEEAQMGYLLEMLPKSAAVTDASIRNDIKYRLMLLNFFSGNTELTEEQKEERMKNNNSDYKHIKDSNDL